MEIYYILLLYLLFLYILQKIGIIFGRKTYIFFAAIAIFFIIAFRDYSVGIDTLTYKKLYYLSEQYVESYKVITPSWNSEFLFFLMANLIRETGATDRLFFSLIGFFSVFSFSIFIYKYSKSPFLSFWLYITLGLFGLYMSGLRQILALSIILFSFNYLIKGNAIRYFISILIATFFHVSAIIMIPIYFIRYIKLTAKKRLVVLTCIVIGSFLAKDIIVNLVFSINVSKRYSEYISRVGVSQTNPLVILVAIGITFIASILYEKSKNNNGKLISESYLFNIFYLMSCINVALLIFSLNIDVVSRLGYYFFVANLVLLPNAIMSMTDKKLQMFMIMSCLVISFAQFLISTPGSPIQIDNYMFFWDS